MAGKKKNNFGNDLNRAVAEVKRLQDEMVKLFRTLRAGNVTEEDFRKNLTQLSDELVKARKQVAALSGVNNELSQSQEKASSSTRGFLGNLMQLELSIRRIQSGFNGMKKTALFAEGPGQALYKFDLMAKLIRESSEQLTKMDMAAAKFGVSMGEPSKFIGDLKTEMAGLRWGEYGGRLGKMVQRWGLNITGHEDAKGLLGALRYNARNVSDMDMPQYMKDLNVDANFMEWLKSGTDEEFFKNIDEQKITNFQDALDKSKDVTKSVGEKLASAHATEIAKLSALGDVTTYVNQSLTQFNKVLQDNPWMQGVKMGYEGVVSAGGAVLGAAGIAKIVRSIFGITAAGAGAATAGAAGAGAATAGAAGAGAATAGAGAGALGVAGLVALPVALAGGLIAGAYWLDKKNADAKRGKRLGETDEEFEKRIAQELKEIIDIRESGRKELVNDFATGSELDAYDEKTKELVSSYQQYADTCREAIKKNNELISRQQAIIDRIKNHETVSDADIAVLSHESGNEEENKKITDQLGGDRDLGRVKQMVVANAINGDSSIGFLPRQIKAYLEETDKSKSLSHLTDVFKKNEDGTFNSWKLDSNQLDQFANYLQTVPEFGKLRKFLLDAPRDYYIPDQFRRKLEKMEDPNAFSWSKLFRMSAVQGGVHGGAIGMSSDLSMKAQKTDKEQKSNKGSEILDGIIAYDKSPHVQEERKRMERMLGKAQEVSEGLAEGGAKVETANEQSDIIQAKADSVENDNSVTQTSTVNNDDSQKSVTVSPQVTIKVDQHVGSADEAGTALKSVMEKADTLTLEKVIEAFEERNGRMFNEASVFYGDKS